MRLIKNVLRIWMPLGLVTTGVCLLAYLLAQQALRQGANDPQIQIAEDAAAAIAAGKSVGDVVASGRIDAGRSLAPFVIVLDDGGSVLGSSATLRDRVPVPPRGVLERAREEGEHRVTWQPEPGVRLAAVIVRVDGGKPGFVVAARSLKEVEARIQRLGLLTAIAWFLILATSLVLGVMGELVFGRRFERDPRLVHSIGVRVARG